MSKNETHQKERKKAELLHFVNVDRQILEFQDWMTSWNSEIGKFANCEKALRRKDADVMLVRVGA